MNRNAGQGCLRFSDAPLLESGFICPHCDGRAHEGVTGAGRIAEEDIPLERPHGDS
jgi:hypothetical protein